MAVKITFCMMKQEKQKVLESNEETDVMAERFREYYTTTPLDGGSGFFS